MVLLDLFLSFLKIGFTCFGGATMVPLVQAEMVSHGWMTLSEVADIVAIAEMTPGPLGTNCATFAGTRVAGALGAVTANLGVLMPTFILAVAVGFFLEQFKENRLLDEALTGIRPAGLGMVVTVVITMGLQSYGSFGDDGLREILSTCGYALLALLPCVALSVTAGWLLEKRAKDGKKTPMKGRTVAMILAAVSVAVLLMVKGYLSWKSMVIGAVALYLLARWKRSVPIVMLVSGALGVLLGTLFP